MLTGMCQKPKEGAPSPQHKACDSPFFSGNKCSRKVAWFLRGLHVRACGMGVITQWEVHMQTDLVGWDRTGWDGMG